MEIVELCNKIELIFTKKMKIDFVNFNEANRIYDLQKFLKKLFLETFENCYKFTTMYVDINNELNNLKDENNELKEEIEWLSSELITLEEIVNELKGQ